MPALAAILRVVIMALVSAAPLTAAQEVVDGTLKKLVGYMRDEEGLTLQEAKDVVGNILADLALNAVILGTIMKTKIAIKTAEYFGFTAKGVTKKVLKGKAATVAKKYAGPLEKFKATSLVNKLIVGGGIFGSLTWIGVGIANVIEPGIYKPREANDVWQRFTGIRPFPEKSVAFSPGNLDAARFNDLARSLEAGGIRGFNDPVNRQSRLYSREDLANIIDYAYGKALLEGQKVADYRDILPLIRPYLIGGTTTPSPSSTQAITSSAPATPASVKVFTGIVSQGVVGSGLSFTPRPDDLIENADELQQAINNNVASYLTALPSRVTYEIKVVSSVIVNGLRKTGTTQRVVSGYYTNGQPKYKTVTNKFAVAYLYLMTDKNTRSKLTTIILGPTDALKFQPTGDDLVNVAAAVAQNVVTSNTNEISTIVSDTPTQSVQREAPGSNEVQRIIPPEAPIVASTQKPVRMPSLSVPPELYMFSGSEGRRYEKEKTTYKLALSVGNDLQGVYFLVGEFVKNGGREQYHSSLVNWYNSLLPEEHEAIQKGQTSYAAESPPIVRNLPQGETPQNISGVDTALPSAALSATTLFSYYAAFGQQQPSLT